MIQKLGFLVKKHQELNRIPFLKNKDSLTESEFKSLESAYYSDFPFSGYDKFSDFHEDKEIKIVISEDRLYRDYLSTDKDLNRLFEELKKWLNIFEETDQIDKLKEAEAILKELESLEHFIVLGEYKSETNEVVLYITNIKDAVTQVGSLSSSAMLLSIVYVHEMMHAYFDREYEQKRIPYIINVEEPLAEAGVLFFAESNYHQADFADIKDYIAKGVSPYRLGVKLYDDYRDKTKQIIESYKHQVGAAEVYNLLCNDYIVNRIKRLKP